MSARIPTTEDILRGYARSAPVYSGAPPGETFLERLSRCSIEQAQGEIEAYELARE